MYDKAIKPAYKACVKTWNCKIGRYDVCIISRIYSLESVLSRYNVAGDGEEWKVEHPLKTHVENSQMWRW